VVTSAPHRGERLLEVLRQAGYVGEVVGPNDDVAGENLAGTDAVLFDVTDADRPALDRLARHIEQSTVAVIAFTTSSDLGSGIAALEAGADDLLSATVTPPELAARVRSAIRRRPAPTSQPASVVLTGGPVTIDVGRRRVTVFEREVMLTALELKLLSYFLMHPDEPITRAHLLEAVWGYSVGGTATVTVHVRRLREKIEPDPAHPVLIRTVWGIGYQFSPSQQ
jgi:DNA-binding response OmpR family regulator